MWERNDPIIDVGTTHIMSGCQERVVEETPDVYKVLSIIVMKVKNIF